LLSKTCLGARKDRVEKKSVQPVSRSSKAVSSGRGAIRTGGFQRIAADIVAN